MKFKLTVNDPKQTHFILDKANADFSHNQIPLNAIIGTLVKYGVSGKIEPYLASSWTVSHDKKNWQFKIRENLKCADGTLITAKLIKDNLLENLKEYSQKKSSVIMFDHLVGWSDFVNHKSNSISGLTFHEDTVELNFDENPDDLLELLRMPYFGLWLEKDHKIISSGSYLLKENTGDKITLKLRDNWFTISENSFNEVEISFISFDEINKDLEPTSIVRMPTFVKANDDQKDGYWISSPPTVIEAFVLSPSKNNFFDKPENRRIFKARVSKLYPNLVTSDFFYLSAKSKGLVETEEKYKVEGSHKKVTFSIERMAYSPKELENLHEIITYALEGSGVSFEIIPRDFSDKDWFSKSLSNNHFDARIGVVDIGGYPIYTAIKMMFCSKLGINFPDPTKEICKIVNEGIVSAKPIDQEFVDKFNKIIHNDAIVIPIRHHSGKWLVSNDFDPQSLPTTTLYPQFELIRLK